MVISAESKEIVERIKELYKQINNYIAVEQELIENLACTVEHFEKSVCV